MLDLRTPGGNAARSGGATLEANHTFSYAIQLIERANPAAAQLALARPARRSDAPRLRPPAAQPGTFPRASLDRLHELFGLPQSVNTGVAPPHSVAAAPATPPGLTWTLTPPSPPGNWFPLLPISIGRLALGSLWNARDLKPAGRVLTDLRSPWLLHQEEVPPEGAQIVRRWQSARAIDGPLLFWIGRSKTPRRTDIPPAIRFDIVEWK